jgi:hypothetical protein
MASDGFAELVIFVDMPTVLGRRPRYYPSSASGSPFKRRLPLNNSQASRRPAPTFSEQCSCSVDQCSSFQGGPIGAPRALHTAKNGIEFPK